MQQNRKPFSAAGKVPVAEPAMLAAFPGIKPA